MASTEVTAPPAEEDAGKWGAMDTLGLIAGAALIMIVIDIVSDGRLISRRLRGPKPAPEPEPQPVPND